MARRTTIVPEESSPPETQDLALHYGFSTTEGKRVRILRKLTELFDDIDPAAEVRRIKSEDEGF